jgi:hypothetical protein
MVDEAVGNAVGYHGTPSVPRDIGIGNGPTSGAPATHDRGSTPKRAKPNVLLLAILLKGYGALFYVRLVGC